MSVFYANNLRLLEDELEIGRYPTDIHICFGKFGKFFLSSDGINYIGLFDIPVTSEDSFIEKFNETFKNIKIIKEARINIITVTDGFHSYYVKEENVDNFIATKSDLFYKIRGQLSVRKTLCCTLSIFKIDFLQPYTSYAKIAIYVLIGELLRSFGVNYRIKNSKKHNDNFLLKSLATSNLNLDDETSNCFYCHVSPEELLLLDDNLLVNNTIVEGNYIFMGDTPSYNSYYTINVTSLHSFIPPTVTIVALINAYKEGEK